MAKKTADTEVDPQVVGDMAKQVEERRRRREEATTVDGSESPSSANAGGEPPE